MSLNLKTYEPARLAWWDEARAAVLPLVLAVLLLLCVAVIYWFRSQLGAATDHQLPAVSATPAVPAYSPAVADGLPSMDGPRAGNEPPPVMNKQLLGEAFEGGGDAVRSAVRAHPVLLLSLVDSEPTVENGVVLGYRLLPVTDAAFLESLGLKPEDVLSTVNGIALEGTDQDQERLASLASTDELTLTVWRDGQLQILTYQPGR